MSATPARSRVVAARLAAGGLVAAALLDPAWPGPARERPPLLVVDVLASVGPAAFDPEAIAYAGRERLVFADGVRPAARGEDPADLPRERTRIAGALRVAGERLGPGGAVWLVTDGRDTEGGAVEAARALAARGIRVDVSAPRPARVDVALHSVRVDRVDADGAVTVVARVASSTSGRVRIVLRRGAATVDQREVEVSPGGLVSVRLRDPGAGEPGTVREVALAPLPGTPNDDPENDRVPFAAAAPERSAVVLDPEPWPTSLPGGPRLRDATPAEVEAADVLVVSNWRRMTAAGAERLARFVAGGGRLLVLGGPEAYGPGGWRGTAFERLLPLRSRPPEGGETDVVIALDRSGSTGERPPGGGPAALEALEDAVAALLDALPGDANVLVLPFEGAPGTPLAPGWTSGDDPEARAALRASARALVARGSTDLDRAIVAATGLLAPRPGSRRHVIVLTDGDPDHALDAASFSGAREALAGVGARFHAVVRGDPRAAEALATLAASPEDVIRIEGAGEFGEALARAFGRAEAGDEIADGPFEVRAAAETGADVPAGAILPSAVHRLEAAPGAQVLATAQRRGGPERLPFAAARTTGAGRVVAVAWGPALEPPAGRAAARAALAPWLAALASEADRGLAGDDGENGRLVVAAGPAWIGKGTVRARASQGDARSDLLEVAPGTFSGPMPADHRTDDVLFVEAEGSAPRPVRLPLRPAPEHRGAGVDEAALRAIAEAGGGRRLAGDEGPAVARERSSVALAPWLLLGALFAFVLERALVLGGARPTAPPSTKMAA